MKTLRKNSLARPGSKKNLDLRFSARPPYRPIQVEVVLSHAVAVKIFSNGAAPAPKALDKWYRVEGLFGGRKVGIYSISRKNRLVVQVLFEISSDLQNLFVLNSKMYGLVSNSSNVEICISLCLFSYGLGTHSMVLTFWVSTKLRKMGFIRFFRPQTPKIRFLVSDTSWVLSWSDLESFCNCTK